MDNDKREGSAEDRPQADSPHLYSDKVPPKYHHDGIDHPRHRQESDLSVSEDTRTLQTLALQMKAFSLEEQKKAGSSSEPAEPMMSENQRSKEPRKRSGKTIDGASGAKHMTGKNSVKAEDIVSETVNFGPDADFGRAFSPSEDFVRGEDEGFEAEEYIPAQKDPEESLLSRLRRWRAKEPSASNLPPDKAAARLLPHIRFLNIRLWVVLGLCAVMVFLTYSHYLGISLPSALVFLPKPYGNIYVFTAILTALQALVMTCAIDSLARGLSDLCHLRPGFESVALLSCLANIMYTVSVFINPNEPVYLPYCAASSLSVLCAMWSQRQRLMSFRQSCMAVSAAGHPFVLSREESLWPGGALVKTQGKAENFVNHLEQPDGAVRFARFFAPIEIIAALLFAVIASWGQQQPARFFWALSAILSVAAPFCGAFCYTLPHLKISKRLSRNGTALAGWTGARAFSDPTSVILTDRDLFPPRTVTLNGLKVFDGFSFEKMICYAASLASASDSVLFYAFEDLLHSQSDTIRPVSSFRYYEGGGLGGEIGRDGVLLGDASFMRRMSVRMPRGIKSENVVFVAVNLELVGVFAIHYNASGPVRTGMSLLLRHGFVPVLATRDVNLTPPFVGKTLGLNLSSAKCPPIEQRLDLSDPERELWADAAVIINRDALYPCAEGIVGGRRLSQVTRINLLIYLLCALTGLLIMAFLTFQGEASAASPRNVIAYMALWTLPTLLSSGWVHRY